LPALIDCSNKPLLSPIGGPAEAPACGGGGGGGTDILAILLQKTTKNVTLISL